jgi:hypothetical protein
MVVSIGTINERTFKKIIVPILFAVIGNNSPFNGTKSFLMLANEATYKFHRFHY